ncbi:MAG: D-alanine--D-alanine ligase family protein, partial [Planctomycetota bacterium]
MVVAVRSAKKGGPATKTKTRVAVVMGGASAERDVSLESGRAVMESLRGADVEAYPYDPAALGLGALVKKKPSTAFLAVHGRGGEDGTLQRRLDALGIRYTGSGPEASALAMDKELTKKTFSRRGIPTPSYRVIPKRSMKNAENLCRDLAYPLVVKPAAEGSSLGVSIADSEFDLRKGLEKAFRFGPRAIVESYIGGREFCIGILGRMTLPIVEVV